MKGDFTVPVDKKPLRNADGTVVRCKLRQGVIIDNKASFLSSRDDRLDNERFFRERTEEAVTVISDYKRR